MNKKLNYRKVLQEQKNKGAITNAYYKKELKYIKQLTNEKLTKNGRPEPIQMVKTRHTIKTAIQHLKHIFNGSK